MKKQRLSKWAHGGMLLAMCAYLVACSSEAQTPTSATSGSGNIEFVFTQEAFQAEHAVTRGTQQPMADTLDLGDGLSAEINVQPDTAATQAATRAPMSDGKYTILVVDPATHLPIAGKKLTGKVVSGTFIADNVLQIEPGTYDFVCYSEGVSESGTQLVVRNNAKCPVIGVTKGVAVSGRKQQITFNMKHTTARVRLQVSSYTAAGSNIKVGLSSSAGLPVSETFTLEGISKGTISGIFSTSEPYTFTPSKQAYASVPKLFKITSDYQYLMEGVALNAVGFSFTEGTVHGTPLNDKRHNIGIPIVLQKNGSYLINVTFKKKAPYCLFNDGTIGYAGDKSATRVPIGLVVREKSAESAQDGMAIALHNAGSGRYRLTTLSIPNVNSESYNHLTFQGFLQDERGYYWTYDKAGSAQANTIKAEKEIDYPAFYQAAHYNPNVSVPVSGIGKWYLPAAGEWKLLIEKLGQTTVSTSGGGGLGIGASPSPNLAQMAAWFTEAGGTIAIDWSEWYVISTEWDYSTIVAAVPAALYNNFPSHSGWFVRPFVHF